MNWPANLTAYNKFLYPLVAALLLAANQKWGIAIPTDDASIAAYVGLVVALVALLAPKNTVKALLPFLLIGAIGVSMTACAGQGEPFGPTGTQQLGYADPEDHLVTGTDASVSPFQWAPTNYAGILGARLVKNPDGTLVAEIIDGKERGGASVALPFGNEPGSPVLTFSSTDSKAFIGQQVRAAVEAEIVKQYGLTIQQLSSEARQAVEFAIQAAICAATGGIGCAAEGAGALLE